MDLRCCCANEFDRFFRKESQIARRDRSDSATSSVSVEAKDTAMESPKTPERKTTPREHSPLNFLASVGSTQVIATGREDYNR